jgi:hypothetical protein
MPSAASLQAFDVQSMAAHELKEQLKTSFSMKV